MSSAKPFRKLPECDSCLYYANEPSDSHLLCAVHPHGAKGEVCSDFREDPNWRQFLKLDWVIEEDLMAEATTESYPDDEIQSPSKPKGNSDCDGERNVKPEERQQGSEDEALHK